MTIKYHTSQRSWAADANIIYTVIGTVVSRFISCVATFFPVEAIRTFFPDHILADHQSSALFWFVISISASARVLYFFWYTHMRGKLSEEQENLFFTFLLPLTSFILAFIPSYQKIGITSTIVFVLCHILLGICAGCEVPALVLKTIKFHQHKNYASTILSISTSIGVNLLSFISLAQPHLKELRFVYLLGGVLGIVGFYLRLGLLQFTSLWQDEPLVQQQTLADYESVGVILYKMRRLVPLFLGLALFSQTYLHATGRGWKEVIQRLAYVCAPQVHLLSSVSITLGVCFKILAGVVGQAYGTIPVFLSSCWMSLLTLPLLYTLSYWNYYPVLGMIAAAIPASIFQCLLYKYKMDMTQQFPLRDIAICWNTVFSLVNILASPLPSLICFHPYGGVNLFILCSSLVSLFILYSHQKVYKSHAQD